MFSRKNLKFFPSKTEPAKFCDKHVKVAHPVREKRERERECVCVCVCDTSDVQTYFKKPCFKAYIDKLRTSSTKQ
jgi:hypothetical protein